MKARHTILLFGLLLGLLALFSACGDDAVSRKVHDLQVLIDSTLSRGASSQSIEDFLAENHFAFDFDAAASRYQVRPPDDSIPYSASQARIGIWVYVQEDRSFDHVVVFKTFPD